MKQAPIAALTPWQIAFLLYEQFQNVAKKPVFLAGIDDFQAYLPHLRLENEGDEACLFIDGLEKTAIYLQKTGQEIQLVCNQSSSAQQLIEHLKNKFSTNIKINVIGNNSNQNLENGDTLFAIQLLFGCITKKQLPPKEINKRLLGYKRALADVSISNVLVPNFREWQTLSNLQFLPDILEQPIYQWEFSAPSSMKLKNAPDFNWQFIFKDYSIVDGTLIVTAENLKMLEQVFSQLTHEKIHLNLLQQNQAQLLALSILAREAKEVLEIEQIKREEQGGGLGLDQVNSALSYFLANRSDVKVLLVPDELKDLNIKQYKYITFAFALDQKHQVAVIIDLDNEKIIEFDSKQLDDGAALEKFLARTPFKKFKLDVLKPYSIQKNDWACGLHIVRNVLTEFNQAFVDNKSQETVSELRTILRASQHNDLIMHEAQKAQEKIQQLQHLKQRLLFLETEIEELKVFFQKEDGTLEERALSLELRGKFETEIGAIIGLNVNAANSQYEKEQYLNQLISNHDKEWPEDLRDFFKHQTITNSMVKNIERDRKLFNFYIEYTAIKLLLAMEQATKHKISQLQSGLTERNRFENERQHKIQTIIEAIAENLDEKITVFRPVLEKQGVRLTNLTIEQWTTLLKNFPKDETQLQQFFQAVQDELIRSPNDNYLDAIWNIKTRKVPGYHLWYRSIFDLTQHPISKRGTRYSHNYDRNFVELLEVTIPSERSDIIRSYPDYVSKNWFNIIKILEGDDRIAVLSKQQLTINDLIRVLREVSLTDKEQISIIHRFFDVISPVLGYFHFKSEYSKTLFETFSTEVKEQVRAKVKENIHDFPSLFVALKFFSPQAVPALIEQHRAKIVSLKQLEQVIDYCWPSQLYAIYVLFSDLFQQFDDVREFAEKLPPQEKLQFVLLHKQTVQNREQLADVMKIFANQQPLSLLEQFKHVFKTTKDAIDFSATLTPNDKELFLQSMVNSADDVEQISKTYSSSELAGFLAKNKPYLTIDLIDRIVATRSMLFGVPGIDALVIELAKDITDFEVLMRINKKYIGRNDEKKFVLQHRHRILTVDHVVMALPFMQPQTKSDPALSDFALQFINLVKTPEDLQKIVGQFKLDTDKKRFITRYQQEQSFKTTAVTQSNQNTTFKSAEEKPDIEKQSSSSVVPKSSQK